MKAFISHSSSDKPLATIVYRYLRDAGVDIWFDRLEMRPGDSLIEKISEGIENSDFLLFLISDSSKSSQWVKKELNIALTLEMNGKGPKVIPVLIGDTEIPTIVADKYHLTIGEDGSGSKELISAIFRESYILDIFLNTDDLTVDTERLRNDLYEYSRSKYKSLNIRIENREFNSKIRSIVRKASTDATYEEHLTNQIKRASEAFDIELPIYWTNLAELIKLLTSEIFENYGKNLEAVKTCTLAISRSIAIAQVTFYRKIRPAVLQDDAIKYGYGGIQNFLERNSILLSLSEDKLIRKIGEVNPHERLVYAELVPRAKMNNIGSRFYITASDDDFQLLRMQSPPETIIFSYSWYTLCLPQLLDRHLHWTAFRKGRPLFELEYDAGFKLAAYAIVGLA